MILLCDLPRDRVTELLTQQFDAAYDTIYGRWFSRLDERPCVVRGDFSVSVDLFRADLVVTKETDLSPSERKEAIVVEGELDFLRLLRLPR